LEVSRDRKNNYFYIVNLMEFLSNLFWRKREKGGGKGGCAAWVKQRNENPRP